MGRHKKIKEIVDQVEEHHMNDKTSLVKKDRVLIPTGSTMLNLSLSDSVFGGYVPGSVVNIVGDSSAGKTFLLWTAFAEIKHHPKFKEYRCIYDEPEHAFYMHIPKLFNMSEDMVETNIQSRTIQEWYQNIMKVIRDDEPFIYGLDSFDSLSSIEEHERAEKLIKSGEDTGSYKTEKARISGEILRMIVDELERTRSIVIVISQTRDKIGAMFGEKKTRSGGYALRFYSTHEYWLSVLGHEKRREREVGVSIKAKVKKNKLTGKLREVEFPIYYDYGVDDISSMIDFLLSEQIWKKKPGGIIDSGGDFPEARIIDLIAYIEKENLEKKLIERIEFVWHDIEESVVTTRKAKYSKVEVEKNEE